METTKHHLTITKGPSDSHASLPGMKLKNILNQVMIDALFVSSFNLHDGKEHWKSDQHSLCDPLTQGYTCYCDRIAEIRQFAVNREWNE